MSWLERLRTAAVAARLEPQVDRFWFLRHGLTDSNKRDVLQGWLDTPLNEVGEAQVREAAPCFVPHDISHIVASPLSRARRSAELVAAATGHTDIRFHDGLRERGVGEHEGKDGTGIHFWELTGDGVETLDQFATRVVQSLNESLTTGAPLIVAHGGIRRVMFAAFGIKDTHFGNAIPLMFTRVGGSWQVERLSENTGQDTFNPLSAV